jgi:cobalt-zinc-cadmium efflux system protein
LFIGDILQSLSVIIVSVLIWISPEKMKIADPIVTFVIAAVVFLTSLKVVKDCLEILMEGIPKGFSLEEFEKEIKQLDGVDEVHDLHVWALGVGKNAMSAHVYTSGNRGLVLRRVTALSRMHGIYHTTVQVETTKDTKHQDYVNCKHNIH